MSSRSLAKPNRASDCWRRLRTGTQRHPRGSGSRIADFSQRSFASRKVASGMTTLFLANEMIAPSTKTRHGHLVKSDAACDFLLNVTPIVLHMFLHLISRPSAARGLRRVGADGLDAGCSLSSDACGPSAGWPWSTIRLPPVHTYTKTSGQPAVLTTEKEKRKGKERKRQAKLTIAFQKMATPG